MVPISSPARRDTLTKAKRARDHPQAGTVKIIPLLLVTLSVTSNCFASSAYPTRLDDPAAVYLTADEFHVNGDGKEDDSAAVQAAIDKLQAAKGEGVVFIPPGRYRLSRTIYLWPGVRVIGYGSQRPVFVLGENTPGYQNGIAYMFFFAGARPRPHSARRAVQRARAGPAPQRLGRRRGAAARQCRHGRAGDP